MRRIAEDGRYAAAVAIGVDEGRSVEANLEAGVGFLEGDGFRVAVAGEAGGEAIGGVEEPSIACFGLEHCRKQALCWRPAGSAPGPVSGRDHEPVSPLPAAGNDPIAMHQSVRRWRSSIGFARHVAPARLAPGGLGSARPTLDRTHGRADALRTTPTRTIRGAASSSANKNATTTNVAMLNTYLIWQRSQEREEVDKFVEHLDHSEDVIPVPMLAAIMHRLERERGGGKCCRGCVAVARPNGWRKPTTRP